MIQETHVLAQLGNAFFLIHAHEPYSSVAAGKNKGNQDLLEYIYIQENGQNHYQIYFYPMTPKGNEYVEIFF
jgi:hypothetical protein